jgi:small subunit ribosomal protein S20
MAHHKSAIKRIQTNERDNQKNKTKLSGLKTQIKKIRAATTKQEGQKQYQIVTAMLDRLASKGMIHKNNAANQKSRLAAFINKLA